MHLMGHDAVFTSEWGDLGIQFKDDLARSRKWTCYLFFERGIRQTVYERLL